MYLLDTDILSNLLKPMPSARLIVKLASVPPEEQFTSSITLGELIYAACRQTTRAAVLLGQIDNTLLPNLPIPPFDETAARRYGQLRTQLERQGTPIGDAGVRIAAIALAGGFTMVTGNVRHFQRVPGLTVENWLE